MGSGYRLILGYKGHKGSLGYEKSGEWRVGWDGRFVLMGQELGIQRVYRSLCTAKGLLTNHS